ncbi:Larval serum protein 2 [Pseudolycoriella hygida]|uniref:Larval serum protein 2 n=1 Tax=Pseudolycoriella hygida TaxID=35572 RepID=A0A9Q0MWD7_9DIPT|nr:Larval serum protein 2 [Pseudolycoriella hygida]
MRSITVLVFACACALASGFYTTKDVKYADSTFLVKQKAFFEVFQHIHQNEVFFKLYDEAKAYKFVDFKDYYTKPGVFDVFYHFYQHGILPQNEIFSIFESYHREQAISLFHLFYYAKDWDTFYKTMVWARFNVNEGMFIYALTVAVLHRPDMSGIVLPAPYEIYPFYYFNNEVVQKAQQYKMQGFYSTKKVENVYTVTIPTNYTGYYYYTNPEQKLSYFTEDIGLNSYYYYFHVDYPFWMGGEEYNLYKDRRGAFFLYQYQQFLARFYLERLSNGLGEIPNFSWEKPIPTGYYPNLRYYNGDFFPVRNNFYEVYTERNYYYIDLVEDYERYIRDAIEFGFITLPGGIYVDLTKPESVEILGNFIEGNPDSKFARLHGYFELAKKLLGGSVETVEHYTVIPSVLEHFETAMRDPIFYQLYKYLIKYYFHWQKHLPQYTYDELNFKGVKIESVEIDKLITFFDKFDADITNVVDVEVFDEKQATPLYKFGRLAHYDGHDFVIKVRQDRLNHVPYTYKLYVDAKEAQKAVVKVFIGPKYNEYGHVFTYEENRENFYEVDYFVVDLVSGKNVVTRSSEDFAYFVKDRTTYYELYKQVMLATSGEVKFPLDMTEAHCGFPMRLMLPKGKRGGYPFQFYFFVYPYTAPKVEQYTGYDKVTSCGVGSGAREVDSTPFGYPFDRPIDEKIWPTPNMYYYDVSIFHKKEMDMNSAH